MNKQQLASRIWAAANKMRSKIDASKYKDYILGFIFYKFLSEKQIEYFRGQGATDEELKELVESEEFSAEIDDAKSNIGYFISYEHLYSSWIEMGDDFNIKDVRDSLSAFSRNIGKDFIDVYNGVFDTLETGLSKLGESTTAQTNAAKGILRLIKDVPVDDKNGYDVLGYIYEYLIGNFAANAGKKGGEFFTPSSVSQLKSMIIAYHLKDEDEIKIYDPCSGSGSLLLHIGKCIEKYNNDKDCVKYYAQELNQETYNLTRMNLILRGVKPGNICTRNGDSLDKDWPYFDDNDPEHTYEPLVNISAVSMNPPYSHDWDPEKHESDPRFMHYGLAPKSKADFAFLLHGFYHLKDGGIQTVVLPHGVLFRGGEEQEIRKNLLENNQIDAIIGLPDNIFFGTGIPTIIMILKKGRAEKDVLFIDASKDYEKKGTKNDLRERDIKKIFDTYIGRKDIPAYSRKVTLEEMRDNEYNLNIPRYISSGDKDEQIDIYASMFGGIPKTEIKAICGEELKVFPSLSDELFENTDNPYTSLKSDDIRKTVSENRDVREFRERYQETFRDFPAFLEHRLLDDICSLKADAVESEISDEIFRCLDGVPLVDEYEAYQTFADLWKTVYGDIEVIKSDGLEAIKAVDPNMVTKDKKSSEDFTEVQEGWKGRIIPFELVQHELMQKDIDAIENLSRSIESNASEYRDIWSNLNQKTDDEEKSDSEKDEGSDDGEIDKNALKKELKDYIGKKAKAVEKGSRIAELLKIYNRLETEDKLKKEQKALVSSLNVKTKDVIENLSNEEQFMLLKKKWIKPLVDEVNELPNSAINNLIDKVERLGHKYSSTMLETETEIEKAEKELSGMLNDLVGSEYDMKGLEEFKKLLGVN